MDLEAVLKIIDSGGNIALLVCLVFINKATERLAKIEKALQRFMVQDEKDN